MAAQEVRVRVRNFRGGDAAILAGAASAALALVWVIYARLTPANGALGFAVCWFAAFLALYWLVVWDNEDRQTATDRLMAVVMATGGLALLVPLVLILSYVVVRGVQALTPAFFTETLEFVGPLDKATAGGGQHAIIGTLQQVTVAMVVSVPLGVLTAVFLNEVGGRLARPVRLFVDAMSGVPSIVAGLFIYSVLIVQFGGGFSGLAGGLALAVLMLPTVTRTAEEMLRLVPGGLREASLAVGAPEWRTTWSVVLPTAKSGLITAVILGVARAVGETAPLIMTSFGSSLRNTNPFSAPQDSLPLFVFNLIRSPQQAQIERAWTGALVLVVIVLALFIVARVLGGTRAIRGAKSVSSPRRRRTTS